MKYDFYLTDVCNAGIYPVLEFKAVKAIQMRMLVPFIFKFLSTVTMLPDKTVLFILNILQIYLIIYSFYHLLNEFFIDKKINSFVAPVIVYPMLWQYIILSGYFIYHDFAILLFIILGYLVILKKKHLLMLLLFFFGTLNHDSIGFLIPMFLIYNYRRLLKKETVLYTLAMIIIFVAVKTTTHFIFISNLYDPFWFRLTRNIEMLIGINKYYIIRDILLAYGGMHLFVIFNVKKIWKQYPSNKLLLSLTFIPYLIIMFIIHTFEDMRDYIASIPYLIIPFLIYLSTFKNSILTAKTSQKTIDL